MSNYCRAKVLSFSKGKIRQNQVILHQFASMLYSLAVGHNHSSNYISQIFIELWYLEFKYIHSADSVYLSMVKICKKFLLLGQTDKFNDTFNKQSNIRVLRAAI